MDPGSKPPFHAVAQLLFETANDFYSCLIPNIEEFKADAVKYTDVQPVILISESVV